jgi:hypothetical protein
MVLKHAEPSHANIEQAKLLYDGGVAPISEILEFLGMSAYQFRTFRNERGWPLRASACARRAERRETKSVAPVRAKPLRALIARLEEAVEREFARIDAALARQTPESIEMSARTLASLVKTLAELKRMSRDADVHKGTAGENGERYGADDENIAPPSRPLAELREELARRLERSRGERRTG